MSIFDSIIGTVTDLGNSVFGDGSTSVEGVSKFLKGGGALAKAALGSSSSGSTTSSSSNGEFLKSALLKDSISPPTPHKVPYGAQPYSVDPFVIENKWNNILQQFMAVGNETVTPGRAQRGYQS